MTRLTLPGEITDADYALCREAAAVIHATHGFVHGRPPADMTADQVALRRDYLSLALLASGDRLAVADHNERIALAKEWIERARAAEAAAVEAAAKEAPPATAQVAKARRKRTTEPSPPVAEPVDEPLPFGP